MHKKNAGRFTWLGGLTLLLAACTNGGGGGGGGSFYVQTCSLGCNNGNGGTQVVCGIVNTFENQDVALLFSDPVDLSSATKQSFQIFELVGAAVPPGNFLIDPLNPNRLIFRPKLSFNSSGKPIFGFLEDKSYQIKLSGTQQKDPAPFVRSTQGADNLSRVLCTITTDQGIIDPVPGRPKVAIFVEQLDGFGGTTTVQLGGVPPFVDDISKTSKITFLFDELMDVGTIVIPSTGLAPFIRIEFDGDGVLATTSDRSIIDGTYAYTVDQSALTTTAIFTPTGSYPGAGSNPAQPRLIVVTVPASVSDIASNPLENFGEFAFAPEISLFAPVTLSEDFTGTGQLDVKRTGADWGGTTPGQLQAGTGGGAGRLGDLTVAPGEVRTLRTVPTPAEATILMTSLPVEGDGITLNGEVFTFRTTLTFPEDLEIKAGNLAWTVGSMVDTLNAYGLANPGSEVAKVSFEQVDYDTMRLTYKTTGTVGNSYGLSVTAVTGGSGIVPGTPSSPTLVGGSLGEVFPATSIITNFDFAGNPGVTPPDALVTDGVFEFATVDIQPGGTLRMIGDNPARLLARGTFDLKDTGLLDVGGESPSTHEGDAPYGQPAGRPGPFGGSGGRGGDRDQSPPTLHGIGGVTLTNSVLDGSPAIGVGGDPALGPGQGGVHWPPVYPTASTTFNDLGVHATSCTSAQIGAAGSGGAYATDGSRAQTISNAIAGINSAGDPACNVPDLVVVLPPFTCPPRYFTAAGSKGSVGLEPPSANPTMERLLTPLLGYLRGGAGGGGGGTGLWGTGMGGLTPCFNFSLQFYKSNSACAGGGGGGGLQVQAGGEARITGQINAAGGDGGTTGPLLGASSPGGGAAGGAVLLQTKTLVINPVADRILVNGGAGGTGPGQTVGGNGGTGLVRVETQDGTTATTVASSVNPIDPMDPTSVNWLSVGPWSFDMGLTTPEEGLSGAQSCWFEPGVTGYYLLNFQTDPAGAAPPAAYGWNMDVWIDFGLGPVLVPYRGNDGSGPSAFGGMYPEEFWGTDLGTAPVVVRFQGARATGILADKCNADPNNPSTGIVFGTATPWVNDPDELNFFFPSPNIVRFQILFDAHNPSAAGTVLGVTNLRIEATPE